MNAKRLKKLIMGIGLVLMTACSSNPVKPPPLPVPDCPKYLTLNDGELSSLSYCTTDKTSCNVPRGTLQKILENHGIANTCILELRGVIMGTHE